MSNSLREASRVSRVKVDHNNFRVQKPSGGPDLLIRDVECDINVFDRKFNLSEEEKMKIDIRLADLIKDLTKHSLSHYTMDDESMFHFGGINLTTAAGTSYVLNVLLQMVTADESASSTLVAKVIAVT